VRSRRSAEEHHRGRRREGHRHIKLRKSLDQALDIILKSKQLGREEVGNIIRVAPIVTLRAEQKEAADAAKSSLALQPLRVRLIR